MTTRGHPSGGMAHQRGERLVVALLAFALWLAPILALGHATMRAPVPGADICRAPSAKTPAEQPAADASAFASAGVELATGKHDDYRPGHRVHVDFGWLKPISERLSIPLQLNVAFKARDRGAEAEPEDTGSTTVALSPRLTWQMSPHWQLYAYYQRPIHQHVNGVPLTPRWSAVLGTTVAF